VQIGTSGRMGDGFVRGNIWHKNKEWKRTYSGDLEPMRVVVKKQNGRLDGGATQPGESLIGGRNWWDVKVRKKPALLVSNKDDTKVT